MHLRPCTAIPVYRSSVTGSFSLQVGDGGIDHAYMGRPEDMTVSRPTMLVNSSHPGTDLAAETAAAFAAGSIAFAQNSKLTRA